MSRRRNINWDRYYFVVFKEDVDYPLAAFCDKSWAVDFCSKTGGEIRSMNFKELAGVAERMIIGDKLPAAVRLGSIGGKIGGPIRASKLSPERRKEIAKKAAMTRWNNHWSSLHKFGCHSTVKGDL